MPIPGDDPISATVQAIALCEGEAQQQVDVEDHQRWDFLQ